MAHGDRCANPRAVEVHQNNHLRIEALRATIAALDGQIKTILTSLAGVRRELTSTGTGVPDAPGHEIRYDELLSYARRISKTTLPPPGLTNGLDADGAGSGTPPSQQDTGAAPTPAPATPAAATPAGLSNGAQTPAGASTPAASQPLGSQLAAPPSSQLTGALPPSIAQFMNPLTGQAFVPWPDASRFRLGALAANQRLLDDGLDIRGYDPAAAAEAARRAADEERLRAEQAEAEEAARAQERDAALREERLRLMQEHNALQGASGASAPDAAALEPARKQFQFMDMDDDDDEN